MIDVHRLDGKRYWINPHQIETITVNPDVTLTMLSGKAVVVRDGPEEIIQKIIAYRKQIGAFGNEA
ncbi:MAG: flagellar FlbD family protein [Spirochaetaceae bacterium]|jgi:flagellar protein FlbD|nr:flagellar FlbD family protein [Spirochaetaceae bacterium]